MESYNPSLPFEERDIKVLFSKPIILMNQYGIYNRSHFAINFDVYEKVHL